jgi:hypothetical protein
MTTDAARYGQLDDHGKGKNGKTGADNAAVPLVTTTISRNLSGLDFTTAFRLACKRAAASSPSSRASAPKRGVFRSVIDLQVAINRFVAETNVDPKPLRLKPPTQKAYSPLLSGGSLLVYVYYEDEPGRRAAVNLPAESRRIATRLSRLPELWRGMQ